MKGRKEYLATYPEWDGGNVSVWEFDSEWRPTSCNPLPSYSNYFNQSPSGFAWGYQGSGSKQLAFAVLYDHLEDLERALDLYLEFESAVIVPLDRHQGWALTEEQIDSAIAEIGKQRMARS